MEESHLMKIFGVRAKVKIIDFLIENKDIEFSTNNLSKKLRMSNADLQYNIKNFIELDMIKRREESGRVLYQLNNDSKIIEKLLQLEYELISYNFTKMKNQIESEAQKMKKIKRLLEK